MSPAVPLPVLPNAVERPTRHGLRRKLAWMSVTVAAVATGVLALCIIRLQERSLLEDLSARATNVAASFLQDAGNAALADDYALLVENMQRVLADAREVHYVAVSRADGRLIYAQQPSRWRERTLQPGDNLPQQAKPVAGLIDTELEGGPAYNLSTPVSLMPGEPWGWLHVGMGLEAYERSVTRSWQIAVLVCMGTILLAGAASYYLAGTLTRPILALQQFAHRITSGRPSAAPVIRCNDEIGDLADSIHTMITSLSLSQEKLRASLHEQAKLREKDVLLREIHHRVKNNLQMLCSLMRLQGRRADSEETREILRTHETRVRSMGLIHEKLYQSESLSEIDMSDYLRTLTDEFMRVGASACRVEIEATGVALPLDTALPCGLIVAELVQNALKHAFPPGHAAAIRIAMTRHEGGGLSLVVEDNGRGMDPALLQGSAKSLGMRLVNLLADQLHGRLSITAPGAGTRIEVTFQEARYRERL